MKKFFLLIATMSLVLTGCSTISYVNKDGERFSYTRIGSQNIKGLTVTKNNGIAEVKLESANPDQTETINSLANLSAKLAGSIATAAVAVPK